MEKKLSVKLVKQVSNIFDILNIYISTMKKTQKKLYVQQKKRYLKNIVGNTEKPRLSVFRSHKHIYGQIIDDESGHTLAFSSTLNKELGIKNTANKEAAYIVGQDLAKQATAKDITTIVFDRGDRPYHGRIKSLAEGARDQGLIF
jgi:large subunit ribosomal protein L18